MTKCVGSWSQGTMGEEDSRPEEAGSGPARVAATAMGECIRPSLCCATTLYTRSRGPVRWDIKGRGHEAGSHPALGVQPSERGLRPAGAQRRAAHVLQRRQPPLSRIDSNFLKSESADSMNQPLPRERVAVPAAQPPFTKQFIPSPGALSKSPRRVPRRAQAGAAGVGDRGGHGPPHPPSPPLSPTPGPPLTPRWPGQLRGRGPARAHSAGGSHRVCAGGVGVGTSGDKCQHRPPGAQHG